MYASVDIRVFVEITVTIAPSIERLVVCLVIRLVTKVVRILTLCSRIPSSGFSSKLSKSVGRR